MPSGKKRRRSQDSKSNKKLQKSGPEQPPSSDEDVDASPRNHVVLSAKERQMQPLLDMMHRTTKDMVKTKSSNSAALDSFTTAFQRTEEDRLHQKISA